MSGTDIGPALDFYPSLPMGLRWGLAFIWQASNDGHQQDSAPGETFRTSWGITQMTWDDAVNHGVTSGDLADATQDQCASIYMADYWNKMLLDDMPPAVAFCLFCDGTLTGSGHIVKLLQRIVGVPQDGIVGRVYTLPAVGAYVAAHGPIALVDALITADEKYLASLQNAPKFIKGWTRREEEQRLWAHELAG